MFKRSIGLLLSITLASTSVVAQKNTYVGINAAAWAIRTVDVKLERHISSSIALQASTGFRLQHRDEGANTFFQGLNQYVQHGNQSVFLSAGARLYEAHAGRYDYPFLAMDLTGLRYHDQVQVNPGAATPEIRHESGWSWGATATMGFVIRLGGRFDLDLALQMGYAPPRKNLLSYYYPGTGYTTFGYSIIGFKGGHVQPLITLKYQIIKDARERIKEMQ